MHSIADLYVCPTGWISILLEMLLLQLPFWFGLIVTKPRDVSFNEMYRMKAGPVATSFSRITRVLFLSLMALFFVGMGLIRAAELGIVK